MCQHHEQRRVAGLPRHHVATADVRQVLVGAVPDLLGDPVVGVRDLPRAATLEGVEQPGVVRRVGPVERRRIAREDGCGLTGRDDHRGSRRLGGRHRRNAHDGENGQSGGEDALDRHSRVFGRSDRRLKGGIGGRQPSWRRASAETLDPSARPAVVDPTAFMTRPRPRGPSAPVSAIASATRSVSSASVSWAGR